MNRLAVCAIAWLALGVMFVGPDQPTPRAANAGQLQQPKDEAKKDAEPMPKGPAIVAKGKDGFPANHPRGHNHPTKETLEARHRISNAKHTAFLKDLPVITVAVYDSRPKGFVPPVGNQKSCGDCYIWSGTKVCSAAQMVAGVVKADGKFMLSPQYFLDCQNVGGCDGGDEQEVAQKIQSGGCPSAAQYGGDGANPGNCKSVSGMTLYTVSNIIMCSQTNGVANAQDIKNCVAAGGYVSVAVAAGSDWDNYTNGTITGRSTGINHAVGIIGWDDNHDNGDGSKGAWIMQNNWDTTWGCPCQNSVFQATEGGYAWVKYGADSIGTQAFFAVAPPPAPPVPVVGVPVITSPLASTATVGTAFSYQVTATGTPTGFGATGLPSGLTMTASGTISGTPTAAGVSSITLSATNASGTGTATLALTVVQTPNPPLPPNPNTTYPSVTLSDGSTLQVIPPGAATSQLLDISGLDAEAQAGMLALYAAFKGQQKPGKNLPPSPKQTPPATMPNKLSTFDKVKLLDERIDELLRNLGGK